MTDANRIKKMHAAACADLPGAVERFSAFMRERKAKPRNCRCGCGQELSHYGVSQARAASRQFVNRIHHRRFRWYRRILAAVFLVIFYLLSSTTYLLAQPPFPPPAPPRPIVCRDWAVLAWDAVPDVAGYRLYWGSTSGVYDWNRDVGTNQSGVASNLCLSETRQVFFAVTAYTTNGIESEFSKEVVITKPIGTNYMKIETLLESSEGPEGPWSLFQFSAAQSYRRFCSGRGPLRAEIGPYPSSRE